MLIFINPRTQRCIGHYAVFDTTGKAIESPLDLPPGWRRDVEEVRRVGGRVEVYYRDYEVVRFSETP